jgi:hypothetical protein
MQPERQAGQGGSVPPDPDEGVPTREEEADQPRSGRPMPEEDAANRTDHHKSNYGGERGRPREKGATPEEREPPQP